MSIWEILGRALCAAIMGLLLGGLTLAIFLNVFPPASETGPFPVIAIIGGGMGGLLGAYVGWRWALEFVDQAIGPVLQLVFKIFD